jgi:hydroxymethylglutaryl-CoA reductase
MKKNALSWQGFSKLSQHERFEKLLMAGLLTDEDLAFIKQGGLQSMNLAEHCIENALGYFQIPYGVATHFNIDGRDYVIPIAVEETSVIAALSKTAKWIRQHGKITTSQKGHCIIGQIQLPLVHNVDACLEILKKHSAHWIREANLKVVPGMVERGGGVMEMRFRCIDRAQGQKMLIIHVYMDPCDAMGANLINQVLEFLKAPIQEATGEKAHLCILSNLNDEKLTSAKVVLHGISEQEGKAIEEASIFAELDPYRAATHNKGIMNGIDGLLIATGNDWRAVEAGMHAFAAMSGQYRALSQWRYHDGTLTGEITGPIVVGTVGGVTALHPMAKMSLKMMNISSANHLARVAAAVGLVQNLGAIRALASEGITQGHMRLHIDNILLSMPELIPEEQQWLRESLLLRIEKKQGISLRVARILFEEHREQLKKNL